MSEYQERHTVLARLIGAPPWHVGFADRGGLTEWAIAATTARVLLLDEIEKAHADAFQAVSARYGPRHAHRQQREKS
jgi:ATP-dependent Clp protease ATP-binding subunit ClpA